MRWILLGVWASACATTPIVPDSLPDPVPEDPVAEHTPAPPPSSCLPAMHGETPQQQQAHLEAVVARGTRCADVFAWLGALQRQAGDHDEAARNFRRALSIESDDPDVLVELALVHLRRDAPEIAALTAHHALQFDPDHGAAHNVLGLTTLGRGDVSGAMRRFARATTLDPNLVEAWLNLGQLALSVRSYDEARRAFEHAVRLRPRSYDARIGLGVARRGLSDLAGAEQEYRAAIELDAGRPEAHFNLGVLWQDHHELDTAAVRTARAHFQNYLERAPASEARENVTRTCRRRRGCRPGRLELLDQMNAALSEPGSEP